MKMRRLAVTALLGLSACSARPACSPETCPGCCTGVGACEPGNTEALCGTGANICATCSTGRVCSGGSCVLAGAGGGSQSGAGGGAAGGGATGGGQTGPGCVSIASFSEDTSTSKGFFTTGPPPTVTAWLFDPPIGPTYDWLSVVQRYPSGIPAAPYKGTLQPVGMQGCNDCVTYFVGCTGPMIMPGCPTAFFAQAGLLRVDELSASPGVYSGAGLNLHLVEWDFSRDGPLDGGRCIDMGSASFNVHW